MPIKVTCNNCGGVLHAPDDAAGKRGRCPTCGTVLTITADAPRVPTPGVAPPAPVLNSPPPYQASGGFPRPAPLAESSSAGFPPPAVQPPAPRPAGRPGGFPKPADDSAGGPPASPDPFRKPGKAATAPATDAAAAVKAWAKVRRGLGWVQAGLVFYFLAAVALPGIEAAAAFGAKLPDKDPGYAGIPGVSTANEIRTLAVGVPGLLGALFIVIGRLGVGSAPRESCGRGLAKLAGYATVLSFLGLAAFTAVGVSAAMNGTVPQVTPTEEVYTIGGTKPFHFSDRATKYLSSVMLSLDEPTGQIQRWGMAAFLGFELVAGVWYLAALGRIAAHLKSTSAAGRVNRFVTAGGLFILLTGGLYLAYDMYGLAWYRENVLVKWNELEYKIRAAAVAGGVAVAGLIVATWKFRVAGGVKRAIRETA